MSFLLGDICGVAGKDPAFDRQSFSRHRQGDRLEKAYLPGCNGLKLRHMYEAMDFLHAHIAEVEEGVFFQTANLFNLSVDSFFMTPLLGRLPSITKTMQTKTLPVSAITAMPKKGIAEKT